MSTATKDMPSRQRESLEKIKALVQTQVVSNEGDDCTPPSFLAIYNLACHGLEAVNPEPREATCEPLPASSSSR